MHARKPETFLPFFGPLSDTLRTHRSRSDMGNGFWRATLRSSTMALATASASSRRAVQRRRTASARSVWPSCSSTRPTYSSSSSALGADVGVAVPSAAGPSLDAPQRCISAFSAIRSASSIILGPMGGPRAGAWSFMHAAALGVRSGKY